MSAQLSAEDIAAKVAAWETLRPREGDSMQLTRVTDCCGRVLLARYTLVGDVHLPEMCDACVTRDGSEHDSHVTCDWSQGVACPGSDWTYSGDPTNPVALPAPDRGSEASE
jgi:hypothetical protein